MFQLFSGILQGDVCKNPNWVDTFPYIENTPVHMADCVMTGTATVAYVNVTSYVDLEGFSGTTVPTAIYEGLQETWIIEIEVPLEAIEKDGDATGKIILHSTMNCGNDVIEIKDKDNWYFGEIPEIGTIAIALAVLGAGFGFYKMKKKQEVKK